MSHRGPDDSGSWMDQDAGISLNFLVNDVLVKLDRAEMTVGLESRAPMLDCHVVEFAWSLPTHLKIRNGEKKW